MAHVICFGSAVFVSLRDVVSMESNFGPSWPVAGITLPLLCAFLSTHLLKI
jgi:hypothetical protein